MKGFGKALSRTPHLLTSKVGMAKKSSDTEFDEQAKQFTVMEETTAKMLKDTKAFTDAVLALLSSGQNFAVSFNNLFQPMAGELDIIGKHPESQDTCRNVAEYQNVMEELRAALAPELELIESRIVGPTKELQTIIKQIRKSITKRDHKLVDFDRHNNSLTKLRDKKEKSLNDEKNLYKLEQDFDVASREYDAINSAMKADLPRFMDLATQYINPLFNSFYYMQLNIYYIMLEKLQGFTSGRYDTSGTTADIATHYDSSRTDAPERIDALSVVKRVISTARMMQTRKASEGSTSSGLSRAATTASADGPPAAGPVRTPSTLGKKPPPPPPGVKSSFTKPAAPFSAPPPYSPSATPAATTSAIVKKAPPPPPPLKPKPKAAEPPKQYVKAVYDFAAQADGDLDFRAGDVIEIVQKSGSNEDWWTGRLNGRQGVFPGNYVQDYN